jgi:hypothetical protein
MAKDAGMDGLDALMAELAAKPQVYFVPIKGVPVGFDESVRWFYQTPKELPKASNSSRNTTKSPKAVDGFTPDGKVDNPLTLSHVTHRISCLQFYLA